jgi:hypothetical protein
VARHLDRPLPSRIIRFYEVEVPSAGNRHVLAANGHGLALR